MPDRLLSPRERVLRALGRLPPGRLGDWTIPASDLRLLSDTPLDDAAQDYFGFADHARALAEILDNESTDTPLTVALSAPWGGGKTSVARMVERLLAGWVAERDGDRPRVMCWFNAWEHDDAPHLGAALAAVVARTVARRRPWWRRLLAPLPAAMLGPQARWRRALVGGAVGLTAAVLLALTEPTRELFASLAGLEGEEQLAGLSLVGVVTAVWVAWRRIFAAAKDAARFVSDPVSQAARGSMAEVSEQLDRLIRQATRGGRLVIFVDDLERCRPARAVEVFQVAAQLLAHPGVAAVLLADMRAIARAAELASVAEGHEPSIGLGRRYMEKLIQLELELPTPDPDDMRRLLRGEPPPDSGAAVVPVAALAPVQRSRRTRTLDLVERAGWIPFAAAVAVSAIVTVTIPSALDNETASTVFGLIIWLTVGIGVVARRRRRRRRQQRLEVEHKVEAALEQFGDQPAAGDDEALERSFAEAAQAGMREHALKAAESYLTVRAPEVAEVERFIERYPPPLPRGAKRMLNHGRLLTKIARDRRMFGGTPELTPTHLGKWIVLGVRWPEVAEQLAGRPGEMARIEALAGDKAKLTEALRMEPVPAFEELAEILGEPPALGPVVDRLVHFEPAGP